VDQYQTVPHTEPDSTTHRTRQYTSCYTGTYYFCTYIVGTVPLQVVQDQWHMTWQASLCQLAGSLHSLAIVLRSPRAAVDPVEVGLVDERLSLQRVRHLTIQHTNTSHRGSMCHAHCTHAIVRHSRYETRTPEINK